MSNIDKQAVTAKTKELASLMVERFSMNPVSCKLLNEAWKKEFPDEVAIAERMLALLDELEHYKSREERVTKLVLDNSTSWDALYKKLEAAEKRIAELQSAVIAPGVMRCAGCGFVLTKNNINMAAGTITAGDSQTEPCPNGCGPLWPVTWREQAIQIRDDSEKWFLELQDAKKRIAELEEIATDYGIKFQKAQDAPKHQALLHKSQMEVAEKQVEELTMWVKRLAHSLRNAKPNSKLHYAAMDYLSRKGLISVEDVLR